MLTVYLRGQRCGTRTAAEEKEIQKEEEAKDQARRRSRRGRDLGKDTLLETSELLHVEQGAETQAGQRPGRVSPTVAGPGQVAPPAVLLAEKRSVQVALEIFVSEVSLSAGNFRR